ncbi:protein archease isoform X2 [Cimex lectularius]|uniref:Archease domain-containing protein n=1 Tax=Cimex lectularius TaxID=79782 RepID=A0A8I6RL51_CIMLE|nr:protein archease isoform X2 [Cimex lectularius]
MLHAWGKDLKEAFEQCAVAMFGYITDLEYVEFAETQTIEAEGEDLSSLLFHFLDEFLFMFSAEPFFIPRVVMITEFNREEFKIKAVGFGETFTIGKHPQGADVKAITYSNMQIHENEDKVELFVIIDI